jgi:signal peptidase I
MNELIKKRPKPWVAFFLGLLFPGFGQIYLGSLRKAMFILAWFWISFGSLTIMWAYFISSFNSLLVLLTLVFVTLITIAALAYREATGDHLAVELRWYRRWYGLLAIFLSFSVVLQPVGGLALKYFVKSYKIPIGSMLPTLAAGDHIFVKKVSYRFRVPFADRTLIDFSAPQRGDIIVFKYPQDETKEFVKRIVGLPGDIVEIRNKDLYVNRQRAEENYIQHSDSRTGVDRRDNLDPVTVPQGSYFVLGDNRDQSLDSRFFGFVSEDKIRGKAFLVYWSLDGNGFGSVGSPGALSVTAGTVLTKI